MSPRNNANSRQTEIQFPPANLSVEYDLGIYGNEILIGHIRSDLADIFGGSGDVVPARMPMDVKRQIESALETRGVLATFTEDKIIIKPALSGKRKGRYPGEDQD